MTSSLQLLTAVGSAEILAELGWLLPIGLVLCSGRRLKFVLSSLHSKRAALNRRASPLYCLIAGCSDVVCERIQGSRSRYWSG